jgi:hypothetical protein
MCLTRTLLLAAILALSGRLQMKPFATLSGYAGCLAVNGWHRSAGIAQGQRQQARQLQGASRAGLTTTIYPKPFGTVDICAGLNVKIVPAAARATKPYAVIIEAERAVQQARCGGSAFRAFSSSIVQSGSCRTKADTVRGQRHLA